MDLEQQAPRRDFHAQRELVGQTITRDVKGHALTGKIVSFAIDAARVSQGVWGSDAFMFAVEYENGDEEDLGEQEVRALLGEPTPTGGKVSSSAPGTATSSSIIDPGHDHAPSIASSLPSPLPSDWALATPNRQPSTLPVTSLSAVHVSSARPEFGLTGVTEASWRMRETLHMLARVVTSAVLDASTQATPHCHVDAQEMLRVWAVVAAHVVAFLQPHASAEAVDSAHHHAAVRVSTRVYDTHVPTTPTSGEAAAATHALLLTPDFSNSFPETARALAQMLGPLPDAMHATEDTHRAGPDSATGPSATIGPPPAAHLPSATQRPTTHAPPPLPHLPMHSLCKVAVTVEDSVTVKHAEHVVCAMRVMTRAGCMHLQDAVVRAQLPLAALAVQPVYSASPSATSVAGDAFDIWITEPADGLGHVMSSVTSTLPPPLVLVLLLWLAGAEALSTDWFLDALPAALFPAAPWTSPADALQHVLATSLQLSLRRLAPMHLLLPRVAV